MNELIKAMFKDMDELKMENEKLNEIMKVLVSGMETIAGTGIKFETENKKLKKMLKLAVEDLDFIREKQGRICHFSFECTECPFSNGQNEGCVKNKWRYADKALKLIGDDKNA